MSDDEPGDLNDRIRDTSFFEMDLTGATDPKDEIIEAMDNIEKAEEALETSTKTTNDTGRMTVDDDAVILQRDTAETLFWAIEWLIKNERYAIYDTPVQADIIRSQGRLMHAADIDVRIDGIDTELNERYGDPDGSGGGDE